MNLIVLTLVLIFIFGLCVGSFLNVLIYRLPRSLAITGRSFCPNCKKKIPWYDNFPLVSFALLGGKCRFCHSPISWRYPAVEVLTGALFVLAYFREIGSIGDIREIGELFFYFFLLSSLIAIFFIDLEQEIIPDQVIYSAVLVSFLLQITNYQLLITNYFPTALMAGGFFLLLHFLTRGRGMGLGDVKLAFLMGLVLGFPKAILAFYGAFLTGAILGVILILAGKKKFGQHLAFGPFLAAWTIVALFWGQMILKWTTAQFF